MAERGEFGPLDYPCIWPVLKGVGVGSVFGASFNLVFGTKPMVIGDDALRRQLLVRNAAKAGVRIGGVVALYTGARCFFAHEEIFPTAAPLAAGALAVGIPFAANPQRQTFFQQYFKENLRGMRIGRAMTVGIAGVSGAVVFGSIDTILSFVGLDWWTIPNHQKSNKLLKSM